VAVSGTEIVVTQGATLHPDGTITEGLAAEHREATAFVLEAGENVSLGRFLTGALALLDPPAAELECCGAALTGQQSDVLRKLNLFSRYSVLNEPTSFRTVIRPAPAAASAVPGPHIRGLADRLRSTVPMAGTRIAILPMRETERFSLANRASLNAWLRAKKVTVIDPASMALKTFSDTIAAASVVMLADPEQAGLLGLCSPGAKILEIAPEGWLGADARCVAAIFDLAYTPFLATAPSYPLLGSIPFGARVPLAYEIPIRALARTLDALG
jgi:hypothetical protein